LIFIKLGLDKRERIWVPLAPVAVAASWPGLERPGYHQPPRRGWVSVPKPTPPLAELGKAPVQMVSSISFIRSQDFRLCLLCKDESLDY
ncbi:MAG: hypothetical protein ACOYNY_08560, partial [Caldilineaceae bacterium]